MAFGDQIEYGDFLICHPNTPAVSNRRIGSNKLFSTSTTTGQLRFADFNRYVPDEESALTLFTRLRLANGFHCPYCDNHKLYAFRDEQNYKCTSCRQRFSIKVGTIFAEAKLPLRTWMLAIWHLTNKPGISSTELAQELGITQKTAWLKMDHLRRASRLHSFTRLLMDYPNADAPIVNAIERLTATINLSTGLDHPGDKIRGERAMAQLFAVDPSIDPAKVRRWAIRRFWDVHSAADLEKIAWKAKEKRTTGRV